jgi:hypothetical protein
LILPFSDLAAERLRAFARAVEPRLAPDGDLDPIVDWASKVVGAVARIAGLIHLASLPQPDDFDPAVTPGLPLSIAMERGAGGEVSLASVDVALFVILSFCQRGVCPHHTLAARVELSLSGQSA